MKLFSPNYYKKFKCIGGSCEENCCIGWEIDIDPETYEKYRDIADGSRRERLSKAIALKDGTARFSLTDRGRCPMLNDQGLCDIITECGEGMLCDICREHPRFYNVFRDFAEVGVGIACPEAARLVLTSPIGEPVLYNEVSDREPDGDYLSDQLELMLTLRQMLYRLTDADISINDLLDRVQCYAEAAYVLSDDLLFGDEVEDLNSAIECSARDIDDCPTSSDLLDLTFSALEAIEALDGDWGSTLVSCKELVYKNSEAFLDYLNSDGGVYFKRLFAYFIYRYLLPAACDLRSLGRVRLSLACALGVTAIGYSGGGELSASVRAATKLSRNVEYSEENVDMLIDMLEEQE